MTYTLITTAGCAPCETMKTVLNKFGIEYTIINANELNQDKNGNRIFGGEIVRSAPVLFYGNEHWGYTLICEGFPGEKLLINLLARRK